MLSALARTLKPITPGPLYRSFQMHAGRRQANRWLHNAGVFPLALKVAEQFNYNVQAGPFTGMKYTRSALLSRHATPALLGVYERQLYPFLEAAAGRCDLVVDIGSAEGYFAVGLARLGKRVVTFDINPHERKICQEMSKANQVSDRITIESWCSPSGLAGLVKGQQRALIISDIEGGELELFTPEVVSGVRHCDLIIEMHGADAQENSAFAARFDDTVQILGHPAPDPAAIERLKFLGPDAARMATEYRPFQQWLVRERSQ
jgi:SAM-dependent methyltransferase